MFFVTRSSLARPSVIIEHEGGTYSVYGHLRSIRVQEGKEVRNCEEIGEAGDIASLNGIKLYFQVSEGTQTVDPLQWDLCYLCSE